MHLIVYTSEYVSGDEDVSKDLSEITAKAKQKNPASGITGLLFYHNGRFLQFIEGEKQALDELMSILDGDPRHKNIEIIINQAISKRSLAQWNMDTFNLSESEKIELDELKAIRDAYKRNLVVESEILASFYKTMLKSHMLKDKDDD